MSSQWRPNDSLSKRNKKGQLNGVTAIRAALRKNHVRLGKGVITSRDPGVAKVTRSLKQKGLPDGVEQWLLPIVLGPDAEVLCFFSHLEPGAIVPTHTHEHSVFRVVISGELKFGRKTLKQGDWMYVPAGVAYSIQAGPHGCCPCYMHP